MKGLLDEVRKLLQTCAGAAAAIAVPSRRENPSYHMLFPHAVDIAAVHKRVDENVYDTLLPLAADLRLAFSQALVFHPEDSAAHHAAAHALKVLLYSLNPLFFVHWLL